MWVIADSCEINSYIVGGFFRGLNQRISWILCQPFRFPVAICEKLPIGLYYQPFIFPSLYFCSSVNDNLTLLERDPEIRL